MDPLPVLLAIIASTWPGRVGLPVAQRFRVRAEQHGGFAVEVADVAEMALPCMDEPHHPRPRCDPHQHTKPGSIRVDAADAVVTMTPKYCYGFSAPRRNAIDYRNQEWTYKPVGFVSFGGVPAGTRAAPARGVRPLSAAMGGGATADCLHPFALRCQRLVESCLLLRRISLDRDLMEVDAGGLLHSEPLARLLDGIGGE